MGAIDILPNGELFDDVSYKDLELHEVLLQMKPFLRITGS